MNYGGELWGSQTGLNFMMFVIIHNVLHSFKNNLRWLLVLTIIQSKVRTVFIYSFFKKNYSSRCREKDLEGHISSVNALIIILVLLILICIYFTMNMYSFGHKKTNNNDLTYVWNLIKAELIEAESRMVVARS